MTDAEFDTVNAEIDATLTHVGVPQPEHGQSMALIESDRAQVVSSTVPAQAQPA